MTSFFLAFSTCSCHFCILVMPLDTSHQHVQKLLENGCVCTFLDYHPSKMLMITIHRLRKTGHKH